MMKQEDPLDPAKLMAQYQAMSHAYSEQKLKAEVAEKKLEPYQELEYSLFHCREEIVSRLRNREFISLLELQGAFPHLSFGHLLHALWFLEERGEVQCSNDLEYIPELLERITFTKRK